MENQEQMNPRQQRLLNDYNDMADLKDQSKGMLDFSVTNNYQQYDLAIDGIETLVGANRGTIRKRHRFIIELPPEYPLQQPTIRFKETIFHPNWYSDGRVCFGTQWVPGDKLSELVIDIIKMMTFEIVNPRSPANSTANDWYLQNAGRIKNVVPKIQFPPPSEEESLEFYDVGDLEFYD